jgi:DNA polymerase-3 subunit gamma/tau
MFAFFAAFYALQSDAFFVILSYMEYVSLYRRFRPKTFDKIIGQDHIVRTLTNQIKSGSIGHAYLFTGTRGTGKTSCAKIFARAVNCLNPRDGSPCGECAVCKAIADSDGVDVIEIDAASNNSVDDIRELKESAFYRPAIGKYKVYIIDEVHMLSQSAFNALLKTLEEPPEHVIFVLATTEVQKLPQTILSRCIRFDFRLVAVDKLVGLMKGIFDELGVKYDERALTRIAIAGEGSVRDTLSIADMCMSYCSGNITYEDTLDVLCATDFSTLDGLASAILDGRTGEALALTDRLLHNGRNGIAKDLANYYSSLISVKNVENYRISNMTDNELAVLKSRAEIYSNYRISRVMEIMSGMEGQLRYASQPRILIEANVVRACELTTEVDTDGVANRLKELEKELKALKENGVRTVAAKVCPADATDSPAPLPPEADEITAEPKKDITELLRQSGAVEDDHTVFDDTEKESDNGRAVELWSRVQENLRSSGESMLALVCGDVNSGFGINGNIFSVTVKDNATFNRLTQESAVKIITEILRRESGNENCAFECRFAESSDTISSEIRASLNDMFSGQIKIKK